MPMAKKGARALCQFKFLRLQFKRVGEKIRKFYDARFFAAAVLFVVDFRAKVRKFIAQVSLKAKWFRVQRRVVG